MESKIEPVKTLLMNMGLNEYQALTLSHLMYLGETKASVISKASGVPDARIYGILDDLSKKGLVIVRPGRPTLYRSMTPDEISNALLLDANQEIRKRLSVIESFNDEFLSSADTIFLRGADVQARVPLLRLVSVEVSLEETRKLYQNAKSSILILTQAMEYLPQVLEELKDAVSRGVKIRILMRSRQKLDEEDAEKRNENILQLQENLQDSVEIRVVEDVFIRGCVVDPNLQGSALFLVEERGVPFVFREAAITSHPGVVLGLASMFDLKWRFESDTPD